MIRENTDQALVEEHKEDESKRRALRGKRGSAKSVDLKSDVLRRRDTSSMDELVKRLQKQRVEEEKKALEALTSGALSL